MRACVLQEIGKAIQNAEEDITSEETKIQQGRGLSSDGSRRLAPGCIEVHTLYRRLIRHGVTAASVAFVFGAVWVRGYRSLLVPSFFFWYRPYHSATTTVTRLASVSNTSWPKKSKGLRFGCLYPEGGG